MGSGKQRSDKEDRKWRYRKKARKKEIDHKRSKE
jgi:hypothetical protein